jgi:enoyl-CoA hydratase
LVNAEFVRLEVDGRVATLRLDRPPVNALNDQLRSELAELAREAAERDDIRAVVVYGGPKNFAAGADIDELAGLTIASLAGQIERLQSSLGAISQIGKPTIAAITGYALGGGLEIALACDFRIASERAKLGLPEIQLGLIPGGGGTQRLARLVGPSVAKRLLFTGAHVPAQQALETGLVDEVVADDRVLARAQELAAEFARGPALALRAAKLAVDEGVDLPLASGLAVERAQFLSLFGTEDRLVGIASFQEKGPGKAEFTGR